MLKQKIKLEYFYSSFTVPCEQFKTVYFASLIMKNIVAPAARFKFPVKLIFCFAFGSASSACDVLKSIATIL